MKGCLMGKKIQTVIIGAGGHARVILSILNYDSKIKVVGFIEKKRRPKETIEGLPIFDIFSLPELVKKRKIRGAIMGIGDNSARAEYFQKIRKLEKYGLEIINAIHPSAIIEKNVKIGKGTVIAAGVVICNNTKIGNNVIINTGAIIDHDSIIEDHAHISPRVAVGGKVTIKRFSWVGIGTSIIHNLTIGESSIVGAGAVVTKNIPKYSLAIGIPTKVIKKLK